MLCRYLKNQYYYKTHLYSALKSFFERLMMVLSLLGVKTETVKSMVSLFLTFSFSHKTEKVLKCLF